MARLSRCFVLLLFIVAGLGTALPISRADGGISKLLTKEWFPSGPDCLGKSLSFIDSKKTLQPIERAKLEGAAYYNDQIFKKLNELPPETREAEIQKTVDYFAAYDGKFQAPSFKQWLKENPGEINPDATIGSYLKDTNDAFLKKYPEGKIEDLVNAVPDELHAIAKLCKENVECNKSKIADLFAKKFNKTCVSKFRKEALKSMVTSIALTNAGYGLATVKKPENGYPFDLMATNLIWTPIIGELSCRNTLEKGGIGNKIDFNQHVFLSVENGKTMANKYISYMIISPLSDATYVGFHTVRQLASGQKEWKDVKMWDLAKQVGSLTMWDAIYPVPRMVLFTDKLYLKHIPTFQRYMYGNYSPVKAAVATHVLDWGSRTVISFASTAMMNWWVDKTDQWWDTKFNEAKPDPADVQAAKNKGKYDPRVHVDYKQHSTDTDSIRTFK